ncbi:hypothetical protein E2C01_013496 [Portunus trituberculatus]|uniref:Uncharacterized protein n=1 Tax=Portunus trituberculatus TaxID=210409 RepID=A0A5B7DGS4_PORTR|nr:hypothetical protein [Portunus trituberculatus]
MWVLRCDWLRRRGSWMAATGAGALVRPSSRSDRSLPLSRPRAFPGSPLLRRCGFLVVRYKKKD